MTNKYDVAMIGGGHNGLTNIIAGLADKIDETTNSKVWIEPVKRYSEDFMPTPIEPEPIPVPPKKSPVPTPTPTIVPIKA